MLTKRTNILFDEALWEVLVAEAKRQGASVGMLVRTALSDRYTQKDKISRRKQSFEYILRARPAPVRGKIDYKKLINYGRKI